MKCENCEKDKPDVRRRINPFVQEIHEIERWEYLCDYCYQQCLEDI